jgi:glutamate--cysteine ligase
MLGATDGFFSDDLDCPLTESAAEAYVGGTCFKTGPPTRVGVELEWLVHDADTPSIPVPTERVWTALTDLIDHPAHPAHPVLPSGGSLSTEPGGQLELSSPPAPLATCLQDTAADLAQIRDRLAAARLTLVGCGLDPERPPRRHTTAPRYVAMEHHFNRHGGAGRMMMCSTASVQVCLDAGADGADIAARWSALHALGPVLVALFANSPLHGGRPTGWRCTRQAIWSRIDPSRTRPPAHSPPSSTGPSGADQLRESYARYALDADLLAVQRAEGPWDAPAGLTFRAWLRGDGPPALGRPTIGDLDYHLSTLFPPVRPRGHFELRVIDAQPADRWRLVTAVVTALLDDPAARDSALAIAEPVTGQWVTAARRAATDRAFARAGAGVLAAAAAGMRRAGLSPDLVAAAEEYGARYPARGRSPADDLLDAWAGNRKPGRAHAAAASTEGSLP